ncbi:SatD family protein [Streptococcus panodentis]|uniref:DNA-binding protein n=1 Tax=Streptococcus panodentis TaxID=1581472 RepID=A0ABS5AVI5_9STRE|nr:SatD family protein [Streptococcus panodentis]MBP2619759.1 DNA-binding protein [Streptococcus panodentis]
MLYIALIGDLIESKQLKNRKQAQKDLQDMMAVLNQDYQAYLVSPFTVTTGDEFQALFRPNPELMQILDQIALGFPHPIRFGLGLGEILTDINPEQSIGADGPAYWRARAAINAVHEKNDYGTSRIAVSLGDDASSQAVNTVLSACSFIQSKWNTSQREVLERMLLEYIYDEDFSHGEVAELLHISSSALSKRLKSSGLKIYLRNRHLAMRMILQEVKESEQ